MRSIFAVETVVDIRLSWSERRKDWRSGPKTEPHRPGDGQMCIKTVN